MRLPVSGLVTIGCELRELVGIKVGLPRLDWIGRESWRLGLHLTGSEIAWSQGSDADEA